MQPIVPVSGDVVPTSIVPTSMAQQVPIGSQQSHQHSGGGGGIQIPTSMEQMTAQATSLLKKIAPTPPSQPPAPQKSTPLLISEEVENPADMVIGGKIICMLFE